MPRNARSNGFTLIELVVVLAVILLLICVLLPALGTVGNQDEMAICANNLRQQGIYNIFYTETYNGSYPTRSANNHAWVWWTPYVVAGWDYNGSSGLVDAYQVLQCPTMYKYGWFNNYEPGWYETFYPGDYRGGSRIGPYGAMYPGIPSYWEFGYGRNMNIWGDRVKVSAWDYPELTGLMAETGSPYWWNGLDGSDSLGHWYADRHIPGEAHVLFMDGHVSSVDTPFPNSSYNDLRNPYPRDGDATFDNKVTIADFLILQNNFNQPGCWTKGDFNHDGSVTIADFLILQNNFGYGTADGTAEGAEELARFAAAAGLTGEKDGLSETSGEKNESGAGDQEAAPLDALCPIAAIVLVALISIGFLALIKTAWRRW